MCNAYECSFYKVGDHATNMPVSMRLCSLINGKYSILERLQYKYDSNGISLIYDESGIEGLNDVQGNIIAILDSTVNVVVKYIACGNHIATPIEEAYTELSQLNPFSLLNTASGYLWDQFNKKEETS